METLEPERGAATSETEPEPLEPMPEVEEAFEEIEVDAPRVGIIMGSASDKPTMQPAGEELQRARDPRSRCGCCRRTATRDAVADYARNAHMRGLRVIIAGAGMSAALPGVVAAHTDLPVIGVPIKAKNTVGDGLDALLSIVQMPPGVPVACVAINGARNAAVLAARILGLLIASRDRPLHAPRDGADLVGAAQARGLAARSSSRSARRWPSRA